MTWYVGFLIGIVVGVIMGRTWNFIFWPSSGVLRIDRSDPEKDLYRLVIIDDLDSLSKKKRIVLKIDDNADLSQK